MVRRERLEPAVPAGADPRRYAKVLAEVHQATLAGEPVATRPRELISESWARVRRRGVDPDHGDDPDPVGTEELEQRRRSSGLAEVLPVLRAGLVTVADEAAHIMVVVDAAGRVLWRDGSSAVRRRADGLGFVEGASWSEETVGTNAIGTALVVRRPIQVWSAEHFVRTHHAWACSSSPVFDPRDGRLLGVIDVSGPAPGIHPSTLALVDAVARLAESHLRGAHQAELERLRAIATPVLARLDGQALAVDRHGWVAAVSGVAPVDRIRVPDRVEADRAWLPALGPCLMEPLPGGWLVRLTDSGDDGEPATSVVLDLRRPSQAVLTVGGPSGAWEHRLSPRHAEILFVLASTRSGRTAHELAGDLFGDPARTITVRAEMSRLRRHLGGVLDHRPYRFSDRVELVVLRPGSPGMLLPWSEAPAVVRLRHPEGRDTA
jgi:hypothetical protein